MRASVEERLQAVEDELAIRSLAARFSDCANERDYEGFADLWTARAVWEIGPPLPARAEGVFAIVAMLKRLLGPKRMFIQMTHSGIMEIRGNRAIARFVERERGKGGNANGEVTYYENLAVYSDELMREADGVWRFSRRVYAYRYLDCSASGGTVFPLTATLAGADAGVTRNAGIEA